MSDRPNRIPNTRPEIVAEFEAVSDTGDRLENKAIPVVAWDHDGMPMIVQAPSGPRKFVRLTRADASPEYIGLNVREDESL